MAKTISGNKIVITAKENGSLFPANREETYKDVLIDGNDEDFDIRGGVFSKRIEITGSGIIKGPIFSENEIKIKNTRKNVVLQSGITALKSLIVEKDCVKSNLNLSVKNANVIIRGDIISENKIELNDTIVIGSILAPFVNLNNCIVFGAIRDTQNLKVNSSIIGIYVTQKVEFSGKNGFFIAGGRSKEKPHINNENSEEATNTEFRYIPLCRLSGYGCNMGEDIEEDIESYALGLTCSLWYQEKCPYRELVKLEKIDFIEMDIDQENSWYLGLQGRSLSLNKINEQNRNFSRVLHGLFAYEHLSNQDKENEKEKWQQMSLSEKYIFEKATK